MTRGGKVLMEVVKSESIYFLHNKYDIDVMKRLICSSVKSGKPIFFSVKESLLQQSEGNTDTLLAAKTKFNFTRHEITLFYNTFYAVVNNVSLVVFR